MLQALDDLGRLLHTAVSQAVIGALILAMLGWGVRVVRRRRLPGYMTRYASLRWPLGPDLSHEVAISQGWAAIVLAIGLALEDLALIETTTAAWHYCHSLSVWAAFSLG